MSTTLSDSAAVQGGSLSPLMRLPAELRLKIYNCYFEDAENTHASSVSQFKGFLPLLQSTRLVRSEAAPLFYKEYITCPNLRNRLVFPSTSSEETGLIQRIAALSSLISIYNPSSEFTIAFESCSDLERLSRAFLEIFIDLMALNARVDRRIIKNYKGMWFGSAPSSQWQHYAFQGKIGSFTFQYRVGGEDDYGFFMDGPSSESFEVSGPLANLDWSRASCAEL